MRATQDKAPRGRTALRLAAIAASVAAATAAFTAGRWNLHVNRHQIQLTPAARRTCPHCRGEGGWWAEGAFPEMEACPCWADRRVRRLRLLPVPAYTDEPPF